MRNPIVQFVLLSLVISLGLYVYRTYFYTFFSGYELEGNMVIAASLATGILTAIFLTLFRPALPLSWGVFRPTVKSLSLSILVFIITPMANLVFIPFPAGLATFVRLAEIMSGKNYPSPVPSLLLIIIFAMAFIVTCLSASLQSRALGIFSYLLVVYSAEILFFGVGYI